MSNQPDCKVIQDSSLGKELGEQECNILGSIMEVKTYPDGTDLVKEGGTDHTLFLLVSGKLQVIVNNGGQEAILYTIQPGESAGTRAFVDRTPRTATLRAVGDCTVYTMEPERFETLLDEHPHLVYKVMRAIFRITHANLIRMNQETQQLENYITKTRGRY